MARIVNQNNEVIGTKKTSGNNKNGNKTTVSKTSFIVGIALALAALAIIIVLILFVTQKNKEDKKKNTSPLLEYIDNYNGRVKSNAKIKLLSKGDIEFEMKNFAGECYILIYDVDWMANNEVDSDIYKSYDKLDSLLTGRPTITDGVAPSGDSFLSAIEDCGQDIKFFVIDINSVQKKDQEAQQNPVYFTTHNGIAMKDLKSPMLFHYIDSEEYGSMNDKDLLIADGNTKSKEWTPIVNKAVNYLNSLTNNSEE